MTIRRKLEHGGDPSWTGRADPAEGWLDLSTGINPVPYPVPTVDLEIWQRLPRRSDMNAMLDAARRYYGAPEAAALVAAPGTQMLIERLPELVETRDVAILSPTYGEHAAGWQAAGHRVTEIKALSELPSDSRIVVIVSPNNPTGAQADRSMIKNLRDEMRTRDGLVIIDEAFCDLTPEESFVDLAGDRVLVFKSFGKFFGLAGMRLGIAIGDEALGKRLDNLLGLWRVSGPAMKIATLAYADTAWQAETRKRLSRDAERLDRLLAPRASFGTDLFRTVAFDDARAVQRHLADHGILVRAFDYSDHWVRFGLPGTEEQWARLELALGQLP